jgi:alkylation response protein AidB-like acyl-CoA dehydrogenase
MFLDETHLQLQKTAKDFTEKEVIPIAAECDHIFEKDKRASHIPENILRRMGDLGFYGIRTAVEDGGAGLGHVALVVVAEELARGWLSVGSNFSRNEASLALVVQPGFERLREKYLAGLLSGEIQTAMANSEADAGSDAANIKCAAKRSDGKWIINGQKMWVTNADRANILHSLVRTDPKITPGKKHWGVSWLVIEKEPWANSDPRLVITELDTVGYHGMGTYQVDFSDFPVPEENMWGQEGRAFSMLMQGYETARIQFAGRCLGVARAAFETALTYVTQRIQFDVPLATFQSIRFRLADMATSIEVCRQYAYHAAQKKDSGVRCDLEAGMAKLFAADMVMKVAWEALQMHGGYGYTRDLPLERYWRDAAMLPIGEGTQEIQRGVISARLLERVMPKK